VGYARVFGYGPVAEFAGTVDDATETITTVAGNIAFHSITVPSWLNGIIGRCYLDVYLPDIRNTNGAENYLAAGNYIKVQANGAGTLYNAIYIPINSLRTVGSGVLTMGRVVGDQDITDAVNASVGGVLTPTWISATSHANSLELRNSYCVLRIIGG
jgi:hypothetical protein